jgi:hypothetical protein
MSNYLAIYPTDPVITELNPLGPSSGMFQTLDMLTGIRLHGLQNFPIDDPHRNVSSHEEIPRYLQVDKTQGEERITR